MAKKVKKAKIVNQPIEFVHCGMESMVEMGIGLHVAPQGENMNFGDKSADRGVWSKAVYNNRTDARKRYRCVKPYLLVPNTPANRKRLGVKRA